MEQVIWQTEPGTTQRESEIVGLILTQELGYVTPAIARDMCKESEVDYKTVVQLVLYQYNRFSRIAVLRDCPICEVETQFGVVTHIDYEEFERSITEGGHMVDPSFEVTLSDPGFNDEFAEKFGEVNKQSAKFQFKVEFHVEHGELSTVHFKTPVGNWHHLKEGGLAQMLYAVADEYFTVLKEEGSDYV